MPSAKNVFRSLRVLRRAIAYSLGAGIGTGWTQPTTGRNVLFFAPEAAVHPHFISMLLAANSARVAGIHPLVVHCDARFDFCPVMQMNKLPYRYSPWSRGKVCASCIGHSQLGYDRFELASNVLRMGDFLSEEKTLLGDLASQTLDPNFELDGIPFGKIAQIDMLFYQKTLALDVEDPELAEGLRRSILSCVKAYFATLRMIDRFEAKAVVHFNDYSIMLAATLAAKKRNIPAITLTHPGHHGADRRRLMVMNENWSVSNDRMVQQWPVLRKLPVPATEVVEILGDMESRLKGQSLHTYSPQSTSSDPRIRLGLSTDKPLIVAYTSSPDEMVAASKMMDAISYRWTADFGPFQDQVEWLACFSTFLAERKELQGVIRIHPREGINRRDQRRSAHFDLLKDALKKTPSNLVVVWPEDAVSSYDLAKHASVVLTSWSSIAVELARLGVKILSTSKDFSYPVGDFAEFSDTKAGYFEALNRLLNREPSLENLIQAFRWYYLSVLAPCIDVSDAVKENRLDDFPKATVSANIGRQVDALIGGPLPLDRDIAARKNYGAFEVVQEKNTILEHLERFSERMETNGGGPCTMTRNLRKMLVRA